MALWILILCYCYNPLLTYIFLIELFKIFQLETLPFTSCILLTCSHCLLCCSLFLIPGYLIYFFALALEVAISSRKPDNFYWTKVFRSHDLHTVISTNIIYVLSVC